MSAVAFAENPRAVIGSNSGTHNPTRAATIILYGAEYLNANFGELLPKLLVARKGKRFMGWRKVLVYCLKGHVLREDLATLLDMNSKTVGEDQQRPALWADEDEEFDEDLEHISQGMHHTICARLNRERIEARLEYWIAQDVALRKLEKQRKLHLKAAKEAEAAAAELEAKAKEKRAKALKKRLKGHADADAIAAQHAGAKIIAKRLSEEALKVLSILAKVEARVSTSEKAKRKSVSAFDTDKLGLWALDECKRLGLAKTAIPYLAKDDDPSAYITAFGQAVVTAAKELGLIAKDKKVADDEDDDEPEDD